MSFRFLIADTYYWDVKGTNDPEIAKEYAASEDYFVVDCEARSWIGTDGEVLPVKEVTRSWDQEEENEDDN